MHSTRAHSLKHRFMWLAALVCVATPGTAYAQAGGQAYRVEIQGAPDGTGDLLKDSSQLHVLKDRPPATIAALGRRADEDKVRLRAVMESEGYYDAAVTAEVTREGDDALVKVTIDAGAPYVVSDIRLEIVDAATEALPPDPVLYDRPLGDVVGRRARAGDVILAEDKALAVLRNNGFPFAARGDRQLDIDRDTHTIAVTLPVKLGPQAVFGKTHVTGLDGVEESFIQRSVPWDEGDIFNLSRLEEFRKTLIDTTLFASVGIAPADTPGMASGTPLDINVVVAEGVPRTISLGASYANDKGLGASASWAHRNFFGKGENFEVSLDANELDQTGAVTLSKPNFLRRDQTLKTGIQAKHADTDAYREWSSTISAGLERKLTELWTVGGGLELEFADLRQTNTPSQNSYLAGLPLSATRAPDDLLLEQTRGWRLYARATPYGGRFQKAVAFLKTEAEVDLYIPLTRSERHVFAARVKAGSIVGDDTDNIPLNKRFYAGGGGSVRGYDFQMVGPLNAANEPVGGRTLIEASVEGRFRITDTIGVVPFVDAGGVSRSALPGANTRIAVGAGLGGRYYTAVGPLRLDLAFPLNPRGAVDKGFKYYLSFGQAF